MRTSTAWQWIRRGVAVAAMYALVLQALLGAVQLTYAAADSAASNSHALCSIDGSSPDEPAKLHDCARCIVTALSLLPPVDTLSRGATLSFRLVAWHATPDAIIAQRLYTPRNAQAPPRLA
jgi:hypothetical protein